MNRRTRSCGGVAILLVGEGGVALVYGAFTKNQAMLFSGIATVALTVGLAGGAILVVEKRRKAIPDEYRSSHFPSVTTELAEIVRTHDPPDVPSGGQKYRAGRVLMRLRRTRRNVGPTPALVCASIRAANGPPDQGKRAGA